MKTHIRIIIISILVGFGSLCIHAVPNQKQLELEKQIWQLEATYWKYWIKGDLESYLSLLHEGFIGWPSSLEKPRDKSAVLEFVQDYLAQKRPSAFEMKPAGIRTIANVSIVHYSLIWKDNDGNQIGDSYRVTHTWIEQEGNWKVLGGMSSIVDEK